MKIYSFVFVAFLLISCKNEPKKQSEDYTIPAENASEKMNPHEQSIAHGKAIYIQFCLRCHMPKGQGLQGVYPPLAASDWLTEKRTAGIHAVKYGLSGEIEVNGKTYNNIMPIMGLSNQEVADVLNYTMTSWGNSQKKPVTEKEVSKITE